MRLGVFFIGSPRSGGLYQYSLSLLDSLRKRGDTIIVFNMSGGDFPTEKYRDYLTVSRSLAAISWLRCCLGNILSKFQPVPASRTTATGARQVAPRKKPNSTSAMAVLFLRLLARLNRIDLLIFTAPSELSFKVGIPYVMPVHDLQHRLNPQFPEVSADGIWEEREYLYRNSIPRAAAILVDSQISKEDILNFYPIDSEKVKVLPYAPPAYLSADDAEKERFISEKYQLPERFLFYPANFWPHKNHRLIVEALYRIKTGSGLRIPLVLVGAKDVSYTAYDDFQQLVKKYGIVEQVHYFGYIPDEDMQWFYRLAEALVMPTFFGPTNIPYLEAFMLGCPVIGSDIRGVREQVGDAGLLVNPDSAEDLSQAITKLWNDARLRETLIKRGYEKTKAWNLDSFSQSLNQIIDEVATRIARN